MMSAQLCLRAQADSVAPPSNPPCPLARVPEVSRCTATNHETKSGRAKAGVHSQKPTRVAILGGGPAGAFCALWLSWLTANDNRRLEVVVFDHKNFDRLGPAGCNMCAGVIPQSLVTHMAEIGLKLPESVIQRRLRGCYLETNAGAIDLPSLDGAPLYATFRGPGPLGVYPEVQQGFDWYLLDQAHRRGVRHESRLVTQVTLPAETGGPYEVRCNDGFAMEADIVVGAFGVNSNLGSVFERLGFGYHPPKTLRARQAEMPIAPDEMPLLLRDRMVIFAMGWPRIRYAAITPKRQHVTVTLIGDSPSRSDMTAFLESEAVRRHFPAGWRPPERYCSCAPQLPVRAARNVVHDRLVVIGDAHVSRYLKNGIESSFFTAKWAAECIARGETLTAEFHRYYVAQCRKYYIRDNIYGRALLRIHDAVTRMGWMTRTHVRVAREEKDRAPGDRPLTEVLWGTFAGAAPYRSLLRKAAGCRLQFRLARTLMTRAKSRSTPVIGGHTRRARRVVIIGGGPAGVACALTLARRHNDGSPPPEVVLLEAKQFGESQNQCAGVLSPPGEEFLTELVGHPLPATLLQRRIRGYVLHGESQSIYLDGRELGELPYALRRVELDQLMLTRAKDCGVTVLHTRAVDIELDRKEGIVYTESGCLAADGIVGAFALDDTMARAFKRHTAYRPPAFLETLACKVHPSSLEYIPELLDDSIHVFLPRRAHIDFGALIPKGNHIVVILAGTHLSLSDIQHFMAQPEVQQFLPAEAPTRGYYRGTFPLGPAKGLFGDSYVVIGDAAGMVRPFKGKGINSALESGRACAEVILAHGFSRAAFRLFIMSRQHLLGDVPYGRMVRKLAMLASRTGMLDPLIQQSKGNQVLRQTLFDCISGRTTYRNIILRPAHASWIPGVIWQCASGRKSATKNCHPGEKR